MMWFYARVINCLTCDNALWPRQGELFEMHVELTNEYLGNEVDRNGSFLDDNLGEFRHSHVGNTPDVNQVENDQGSSSRRDWKRPSQ